MAFQLAEAFVELNAKGFRGVTGAIDGVRAKMGSLVSFATGPFGAAIASVGAAASVGGMVALASRVETTTAQFKTLLGSADLAKQKMEELQAFSASTPFQFDGLAEAAKSLLAFGVSNEQVIPTMKVLGDIAAATGNDIGSLASIFGKARSQGKLTTDVLNQLGERGIPIGAALAKQFGKTEAEIREMASSGELSFSDLQKAMNSMTEEGGIAFDGMAEQAGTLAGVWSTFKDNISLLMGDIGQAIVDGFDMKDATTSITDFVQRVRTEWMPKIVAGFQWLSQNIITPVMDAMKSIGSVVAELIQDFDLYWRLAQLSIANAMLNAYQHVTTFYENSVTIAKWWYTSAIQIFRNFVENGASFFGQFIKANIAQWKALLIYMATGKVDPKPFLEFVAVAAKALKGVKMPELKTPELNGLQDRIDKVQEGLAERQRRRDEERRKRLEAMRNQEVAGMEVDDNKKDENIRDEADDFENKEDRKIAKIKDRAQVEKQADDAKQRRQGAFVGLSDLADRMQMQLFEDSEKRRKKAEEEKQKAAAERAANPVQAVDPEAIKQQRIAAREERKFQQAHQMMQKRRAREEEAGLLPPRPIDQAQAGAGGRMADEAGNKQMADAMARSAAATESLKDLIATTGIKVVMPNTGVNLPAGINQFGPRA